MRREERGILILVLAIAILPLAWFLLSLILDVETYHEEEARLQRALDERAVSAVRFLPFVPLAREIIQRDLSDAGMLEGSDINLIGDRISIYYRGTKKFSFASILAARGQLPVAIFSEARLPPRDVFLGIDLGGGIAPLLSADSGWGAEKEWPPSSIFVGREALYGAADVRFLTAQCFNPLLHELKSVAVRLYDFVSSLPSSRSAVALFPGRGGAEEVVKRLGPDSACGADIPIPEHFEVFGSDSVCGEVAHETARYVIPNRDQRYGTACADSSSMATAPENFVKLRDAIWDSVGRPGEVTDWRYELGAIGTELFAAPDFAGNAAAEPRVKHAVIVSTSLPSIGGIPSTSEDGDREIRKSMRALCDLAAFGGKAVTVSYLHIFLTDHRDVVTSERVRTVFEQESGPCGTGSLTAELVEVPVDGVHDDEIDAAIDNAARRGLLGVISR